MTIRYSHLRQAGGIEIVDADNKPLGVMDYKTIVRQNLSHRSIALLLRDTAGRFLLTFQTGAGWNFSSVAPVPAGQSCETCAAITLRRQWNLHTHILPVGLYPPCKENGNSFVAVFKAKLPSLMAVTLTAEPERHLLLNYDELTGLVTHFSHMLTPYIRIALQNAYIRP
ncbi:MAG: NUDIX hydrolase [Desulfovibrio sp.]|jgi:hypothetical protein|nr:NUDIX hydrolase [Desulfovibrio sp.]